MVDSPSFSVVRGISAGAKSKGKSKGEWIFSPLVEGVWEKRGEGGREGGIKKRDSHI